MKKLIALGLIIFATQIVYSQSGIEHLTHLKNKKEQLQRIANICDSLNYLEEYAQTRQISQYALTLMDENDHYNRSLFEYYIGVSYNGVIYDSAVLYLEKSLHHARLAKNSKRIINALHELLYIYINVDGYTTKRDKTATEINRILDTTTNTHVKINCFAILADYYSAIGWYEQELDYRLQRLELSITDMKQGKYKHTDTDSTNIGVAYFNLGYLYEKLNQYPKAQEYYNLSKPLLWNYTAGLCSYYKGMATTSLKQGDIVKSRSYIDSLKKLVEQKMNVLSGWSILLDLYLNNADYYLDQQNASAAMPYLKQAEILINNKIKETTEVSAFQYTMGKALMMQQDYKTALLYLQQAERVKSAFTASEYAKLLRALAECYEGLNKSKEATAYYKKYLPLRDSIDAKSALQSMANAEARYQNKEKMQQIEAQKTQIEFANKQRFWLISGLVLLGLIATLLTFIYRNKKKTADALNDKNKQLFKLNNELNEANQTKAKLFSIISHDLRTPINQVYQFLKLQQHNANILSEVQKVELNNKIQKATGSLLETMEDMLVWSKTQMHEFKTTIQTVHVFEKVQQILALLQLNIVAKNVAIHNETPTQLIINTDPYYIEIILRNLLQNAIKYAPENTKIILRANATSITIANQGVPFTQQQYEAILIDKEGTNVLSGLGLKIADELCKRINASLQFHAETDGYTYSTLNLSDQ